MARNSAEAGLALARKAIIVDAVSNRRYDIADEDWRSDPHQQAGKWKIGFEKSDVEMKHVHRVELKHVHLDEKPVTGRPVIGPDAGTPLHQPGRASPHRLQQPPRE